jgi:hypothetical protein
MSKEVEVQVKHEVSKSQTIFSVAANFNETVQWKAANATPDNSDAS